MERSKAPEDGGAEVRVCQFVDVDDNDNNYFINNNNCFCYYLYCFSYFFCYSHLVQHCSNVKASPSIIFYLLLFYH